MARNDESIAKLNKDKKTLEENLAKAQEHLQAEEDKANHLAKLKHKLETSIEDVSGEGENMIILASGSYSDNWETYGNEEKVYMNHSLFKQYWFMNSMFLNVLD